MKSHFRPIWSVVWSKAFSYLLGAVHYMSGWKNQFLPKTTITLCPVHTHQCIFNIIMLQCMNPHFRPICYPLWFHTFWRAMHYMFSWKKKIPQNHDYTVSSSYTSVYFDIILLKHMNSYCQCLIFRGILCMVSQYMRCVMREQTLRSLSLSYPKRDGRGLKLGLFCFVFTLLF